MKIRSFSFCCISFLSLAFVLACAVSSVQAESELQWGTKDKTSMTGGGELRWGTPKTKGGVNGNGIIQATSTNRTATDIVLVQHVEPMRTAPTPKPMTEAQLELVFPDKRRTISDNPPAGAISVPLSSGDISTNLPKREAYLSDKDAVDAKINSVLNPNLPEDESIGVERKDPSLDTQPSFLRDAATKNVPPKNLPPAPVRSYATKEIPCPSHANMKSIREISYDIRPMPGTLPKECPLNATAYTGRHFSQTCYQWKAAALCTKGAYFEDVQLERYGHSICPALQPVISGAKFFLTVPFLPYKMGLTPPNECVYTLGHYRAGNCAPYMLDPLPISVRAILFEGLAIGGAVAVIP